jgi:hypothetical protein
MRSIGGATLKVIHWSLVFAIATFFAVAEYTKANINPVGVSASIATAVVIGAFVRPFIK